MREKLYNSGSTPPSPTILTLPQGNHPFTIYYLLFSRELRLGFFPFPMRKDFPHSLSATFHIYVYTAYKTSDKPLSATPHYLVDLFGVFIWGGVTIH